MADNTKGLFKSLTVLGAVLAGLPGLDTIFLQFGWIAQPVFGPFADAALSLVGALTALYGRARAKKFIKGLF